MIAGVIIAGGKSSRMGVSDKCLLALAGKPILEHIINRLQPQVQEIALNTNSNPQLFQQFNLKIIPDIHKGLGPLSGIHTGMNWAKSHPKNFSHIVTIASDTPFFPRDLVQKLSHATLRKDQVVLASSGGRLHPTFGLWPVSLAERLQASLNSYGASSVRNFASSITPALNTEFDLINSLDPFFNINTTADLAQAELLTADLLP